MFWTQQIFQGGDWQEIIKIFGVSYGYGYQEILSIPLDEIFELLPDAIEIYKQKTILRKAILTYLGVKE